MPLEQLGPYKIERMLGRGGMGAVYAGVNEQTQERAAVKVLSPTLADDSAFRQRFKAEIETLKALHHPNIVQLFGYGEQDGHLFYAMELVEGQNLQDAMAAGRKFNWREVCHIGIEICQGLKYAHNVGVIHRDLKPANLLITPDDTIKLTDFGIARLFGMSHLTADGGVLGTADYMAPEQAEGRPVSARCDMYSLGCVLFALLARRPPFAGPSLPEVLHALRYDPAPSVRRYAPQTPPELDRIIAQLLEKDPQDRVATPLLLSNRLKAMLYALTDEKESPADDEFEIRLQAIPEPPLTRISSRTTHDELPRPVDRPTTGPRPTRALATDAPAAVDDEAPAAPARHFTLVDNAAPKSHTTTSTHDDDGLPRWLLLTIAAVLVTCAAALAWYFALPPSANSLYTKIEAAAKAGDPASLGDAESEIDEFLSLYGSDPRYNDVIAYRDELNLFRLQRRLEFRARRLKGDESLQPVEQAYLDAMSLERTAPEKAAAQLQAVIELYGSSPQAMRTTEGKPGSAAIINTQRCVDLARKQLANLQARLAESRQTHQKVLTSRLDDARSLAKQHPAAARMICTALITLYADKPWAEESVAQAQALLQELPAESEQQPAE